MRAMVRATPIVAERRGSPMKCVSIAFALGALVTGLTAAFHWYKASEVPIDPGWTPENPEPVDEELKQMDLNVAIIKAAGESAALNKIAALWTAAAVVLGAISSFIESLISD
jgi:hypothetical protein